jgi:glyoxylase-like metal-dependent hydrolase (beta-lactamase superfamily II)
MNVTTLHLGSLGTNCYLVPSGENRCIIIDIGDGAAKLRDTLETKGLTPEAILLTHGHYDHVAGVEAIRDAYQIPVYIHKDDENCLHSGQANLAYQLTDKAFIPVKEYKTLSDGDELHIGELTISVLHTPGHTPGGVCYQIGDALFTGDTLFAGSAGRIDLGGNAHDMRASLERLASLSGDYEVYPGHMGSSTLDFERANNPYMGGLL